MMQICPGKVGASVAVASGVDGIFVQGILRFGNIDALDGTLV